MSVYLAVMLQGSKRVCLIPGTPNVFGGWRAEGREGGREGRREGRHEVSSEVWKIWLSLDKRRPWKKEMEKGKYSRREGSMYKCRRMSVVVITVDPDIRSTPVIRPGHSRSSYFPCVDWPEQ